jgi:integrase
MTPARWLESIKPAVIEKYKVSRREKLRKNGGSIALDMAVLHRVFAFAIEKELIAKNCINGANETKPGKKPKAPARPLNAEELQKLREAAGRDNLAFLLLRWTGLRGGDAVNLIWADVRFDQGENGEIEVMTQKRRKKAIIPLMPELRTALENARKQARPADFVLCNPYTGLAYSKGNASTNDAGRKKLYERIKELGNRAKVDVTPHDLRDTFACDMIARGIDIYIVAMMLADTVSTVESSYSKFVQAARDAAQHKMVTGIGIEERATLNREKGQKIVSFPGSA